VFEGFVASEIVKRRLNCGLGRGLYYFRDRQGLEVDFLVDQGNRLLSLLEVKATRTPSPDDARALTRLLDCVSSYTTKAFLVHAGAKAQADPAVLCRGVKMVGIDALSAVL
jgi:predicted AAA+ superfamily ATPase